MTTTPTQATPSPIIGQVPAPGITLPAGGLAFDAGYPLAFPPVAPLDLAALFPTYMPQVERVVYERIKEACSSRTIFPFDGQGLPLPAAFNVPPDISLYAGWDSTYPNPMFGQAPPNAPAQPATVPPILVVRGWPAYPGAIPAIGVCETNTSEDDGETAIDAGFAGDVYATDQLGNVIATAAYYAEALSVTVVVELIHLNRDERDRLHDQLYRVIYPLRRLLPSSSSQISEVKVSNEKQELPVPEQPDPMYVSIFTVMVACEVLIPTEIVANGMVEQIITAVTPIVIPQTLDANAPIDLT